MNRASAYDELKTSLRAHARVWLVTGAAGFIGSNLVEHLLKLDQVVVGLDNFATGKRENLAEVQSLVTAKQWGRFRFLEGSIEDLAACREACREADYVLHQAALGSVPRSIEDPLGSNASNVTGFLNMLVAARDAGVKRFVYASSSSVYGDDPNLPKVEETTGRPLSPYAVTKLVNEIYAQNFGMVYGLETVGLRYFNVFGPRQDPEGAYAAVIPKWVATMIEGGRAFINGTGETSRDFCYIENVVQANLLAAATTNPEAVNQACNVALGTRTTLNELFEVLRKGLLPHYAHLQDYQPIYQDFRKGDVMHSLADIGKARRLLGYEPTHTLQEGLREALDWYRRNLS